MYEQRLFCVFNIWYFCSVCAKTTAERACHRRASLPGVVFAFLISVLKSVPFSFLLPNDLITAWNMFVLFLFLFSFFGFFKLFAVTQVFPCSSTQFMIRIHSYICHSQFQSHYIVWCRFIHSIRHVYTFSFKTDQSMCNQMK